MNVGARVLILVVIVWSIARRLDLGEAASLLRSPEPLSLLGMIVCALVYGVVGGIKIWTLLRAVAKVSLKQTVVYFFVASSIGTFTPAALGDFSLAAFLKREDVPVHEGLAVVLVDRLVSVSLYALVFAPLTLTWLVPNAVLGWLPILYLLGGMGLVGLNGSARARGWVRAKLVERYIPRAGSFLETSSRLMRAYPTALAGNVFMGLVRGFVGGMVIWFALVAVGTQVSLFPVVAATNTLSLINMLPISFGGLGVYEGGGVLLFEALGLDASRVLAALLLQRIYVLVSSVLVVTCAGIVILWQRRHPQIGQEVHPV